jgi:hypothetical protein
VYHEPSTVQRVAVALGVLWLLTWPLLAPLIVLACAGLGWLWARRHGRKMAPPLEGAAVEPWAHDAHH